MVDPARDQGVSQYQNIIMRVAIQLVTYHGSQDLPILLESLNQQIMKDWKLFVYENSCDRVEAGRVQSLLEASSISCHLFISDKNTGFDGGHQALFMMHDAPYVLLLNNDAKLEPAYLEAVIRRMESDATIGSVTGLVYRWTDDQTRIIDTAGLDYHCLGQIVDRFAGQVASTVADAIARAGKVFGVSGAIGLYRHSAIDQAGGLFDPNWFMYKEDADLAIRLKRAGFSAWFEPTAVAFHRRGLKEEGHGLFDRLANERRRSPLLRQCSYVNQWRMYRRYFRASLGVRDICQTIAIEAGRSVLVFLASPRVFFRAWRQLLIG